MAGGEGELKELIYGQVDATFYGAEAKSSFDVMKASGGKLVLNGLADYVHAALSDGEGNVPRIPPYHVGAGLAWQGERFDGGFLVKYAGAHTETATAETPTGGFVSIDANFTWRPIAAYSNFEVTLVGRNLTDSAQRIPWLSTRMWSFNPGGMRGCSFALVSDAAVGGGGMHGRCMPPGHRTARGTPFVKEGRADNCRGAAGAG